MYGLLDLAGAVGGILKAVQRLPLTAKHIKLDLDTLVLLARSITVPNLLSTSGLASEKRFSVQARAPGGQVPWASYGVGVVDTCPKKLYKLALVYII